MITLPRQREDEGRKTNDSIRFSAFAFRPNAQLALEVLFAGTGTAWLAAAAVTGQRYPGLSLAWLVPFALSFAAVAVGATLMSLLAVKLRADGPASVVRAVFAPLLVAWLPVLLLLASTQANHYFANWPRLRVASLTALGVLAGTTLLLQSLVLLQQRFGLCTLLVRRIGAAVTVFAGSFVLFLAAGGGHLYTPDEWTIYATAAGLVNHGVPAAFAGEPYPLHHMVGPIPPADRAPDGSYAYAYTKYGVLPSLLAAPLYALARFTGPSPTLPVDAFPYGNLAFPLVALLFNPLVTAATVAILFQTVVDLGYSRRVALGTAAAFGFASLAFPFSKTLMNMPLAAGLLTASFWCSIRADLRPSERASRWATAAGVFAGLAVATRYETLLFTAPIGAYLLWSRARSIPSFAAGFAVAFLPLVLGMNVIRTGSFFNFGYGEEGTLSSLSPKPWYGLFGILLSPGCGLVSHTPLVALGLVALAWFWDDAPRPAVAAGTIALLGILYYGSLSTWCGYTTWGPRYLVTVGPFMVLPLAALWHRLRLAGKNPFIWFSLGSLALWSLATNLLAVLIDFNRGWQDHWAFGVTYLEVTWLPFFSGITSHLRLLREWLMDGSGGVDLYLLYVPAGWQIVPSLIVLGIACWTAAFLSTIDPNTHQRPG